MAANFDSYLDVEVESIERPKAPPVGHYFARTGKGKPTERFYDKSNPTKGTPVWEQSFILTGADTDVDETELPEKGVAGRVVTNDYDLAEPWALRALAEETLELPVKGLALRDLVAMLPDQDCKVYLEKRLGTGAREGQEFPQVKKVLKA